MTQNDQRQSDSREAIEEIIDRHARGEISTALAVITLSKLGASKETIERVLDLD